MRSTPKLGRILGVRIQLHYTWAIALVLIAAAVATQFSEAYPLWERILLGIAASLLFFIAVSTRELILNFMAIAKGISVKNITLFVFGGVPQLTEEATSSTLELLLATAGLLINLLIAGILYGAHIALVIAGNMMLDGIIQWLAFIYFMLVLFHLVPAFPLDGGRILRALLWRASGNYDRVTLIASWVGWAIGLLSLVSGIVLLITTQQRFAGLLLVVPGWTLLSAAAQSRRQALRHAALQGITARDVMTTDYPFITQQLSLGQLIRDYILVTGLRYFVVVDEAKLQGIVTMRNIKRIPKRRRDSTSIGEIMIPTSKLKTAHAEQPAINLLEQMDNLEINQMPVLEEDKVIGIVARDSLIRLVKTRTEL